MKTSVEAVGPCRKKLRVEVPAEEVQAEYDKMAAEYAQHAKVPGFRPGRAPRDVVERRFGKSILEELRDQLVPRSYHGALQQEKLVPVAILDLEEPTVAKGQPLIFSVVLDVPPDFTLPEYKGITVTNEAKAVSEEDVQKTIDGLREQATRYEEVSGRPAQANDLVQVDYTGTIDGQPLEAVAPDAQGLGQAKDFWVNLGPHAFLPGFAEGLAGAAVGEAREITSAFAADFRSPALAGRTAKYAVTVKAIRCPVLPELDADFLKRCGATTVDELKQHVRTSLEASAKETEERRRRDEIARYLIGGTPMDLPATIVQHETEQHVYGMVREHARRGIPESAIVENKSRIFETASRTATESVKLRFILHRIAGEEKLSVTDAEFDRHVAALAQSQNLSPEAFRAQLAKRKALDDLRGDLQASKVMDLLVASAKVQ